MKFANGIAPGIPRGIDVIVRFHDMNRLAELDRALFSLACQSFTPMRCILVTQGLSEAESSVVSDYIRKHQWEDGRTVEQLNVPNPKNSDLRSVLLNIGIANVSYRYLAFLDADDYIYERAYETLIQKSESSGAAVTFGNVRVKHICDLGGWVYNVTERSDVFKGSSFDDLLIDNFCPIHSFVLDRAQIAAEDIYFDERLTRLEDYHLLLRLGHKYKFEYPDRSSFVGVYNWHLDGRNSIQVGSERSEQRQTKQHAWIPSKKLIWIEKLKVRGQIAKAKTSRNSGSDVTSQA